MDKVKIGFIGCGNMVRAMIGGILREKIFTGDEILISAKTKSSRERTREKFQVNTAQNNKEVARKSPILVLAVKPQYYEEVIEEIKKEITKDQIIVSIAPGKTLEWLEEKFGGSIKAVRLMPNTPALIGEGMTGVCCSETVEDEELERVCEVVQCFGRMEVVPESMMDVVVSVSGSAPAYVFLFIEAMADAAVADGMPRKLAYEFAAQAVMGSAKMVLDTQRHPGELKDMVCSPGGTTIEAVRSLEKAGFRSSVMEAMKVCTEKSRTM